MMLFETNKDLNYHKRLVHKTFSCKYCFKVFNQKRTLEEHQRNGCKSKICGKQINREQQLTENVTEKISEQERSLKKGKKKKKTKRSLPLENAISSSLTTSEAESVSSVQDRSLSECKKRNWNSIKTNVSQNKFRRFFNFALGGKFKNMINEIYSTVTKAQPSIYKINYSVGYITKSDDSSKLEYHSAYDIDRQVLESDKIINQDRDLLQLLKSLSKQDLEQLASQTKTTSDSVVEVTNIAFSVKISKNMQK